MLTPELENENPITELERKKYTTIDIQTRAVQLAGGLDGTTTVHPLVQHTVRLDGTT